MLNAVTARSGCLTNNRSLNTAASSVIFRQASFVLAASMGLLNLTVESGQAQIVDRSGAEMVMRELMPTTVRCGRVLWDEPISYCRYETANLVFELSFGADGLAGSLTYNIGSGGRHFLNTMRIFFSRIGVQEKIFVECINQSKSESVEVLARNFLVKCRYADIADRVAYEISAGPI